LVLDLQGARLVAPAALYDGQNRGGIKNVRYAQFRPGVVRVVIDLDVLKDYQVERRDGQVRVKIGADRTAFAGWSSLDAAAPPLRVAERGPGSEDRAAARRSGGAAARVAPPSTSDNPMSIDEYLAAHANEAAQSRAPRITVTWDRADIQEVVAGFAAFSGRTIVVNKGITGQLSAEIKNQPWDLAFNAVLESQGLTANVLEGGILQVIDKKDLARADPTDALVPQENFKSTDVIVDLGGNSLSALGNADQQVVNPALDLIFSTAIGNFDLTTFLQALQRVELADLQAEPTITTLDNRPAEILVGDRVPIRVIDVSSAAAGGTNVVPRATVHFEQTGINHKVTPHVTANRQVLMEVHAENSSVKPASVDIGFTFQTQQADNQILVNDGETAVIGGLTVTSVTVTKSGIPFLVDLPILGKLFGFT